MCFRKIAGLLCLLGFFNLYLYSSATVYIIPPGYEKNPNEFDGGVFAKLKKSLNILGFDCKFISLHSVPDIPKQELKYLIFIDFSHHVPDYNRFPEIHTIGYNQHIKKLLSRFDKDKLALMCFEPEAYDAENHDIENHKLFGKVITCYDKFKGPKYHKFYYPVPTSDKTDPQIPFNNRKLATLINGCKTSNHYNELYSERLNVIKFFENKRTNDFEFYGVGWNKKLYKNYMGNVDDKIGTLKKYKFCYCFENTKNVTGYISEKILDCLSAGCVPIYWGAINIDWYIPKECYILRKGFASLDDMYKFIKNMPESRYQKYIENIRKYLASDAVLLFSWENFIDTALTALFPNYDKAKVFNEMELDVLTRLDAWKLQNLFDLTN